MFCWVFGRPCVAQPSDGDEDRAAAHIVPAPNPVGLIGASLQSPNDRRSSSVDRPRRDAQRVAAPAPVASRRLGDDEPAASADDEPSRASRWRERREAKRKTMKPPRASWLERTGRFIERTQGAVMGDQLLLDVPDIDLYGVRPVFGGLPSNAGLSAGLNYEPRFLVGPNRHAHAQALYSLNGYYGGDAVYGSEGESFVRYAYARYHHKPREEFYGIGPSSRKDRESVYGLDEAVVGGLLGRVLDDNLLVGTHASYLANRFHKGTATDQPYVTNSFPDASGVGRDVDYVMVGSFVEYDSRNIPVDRGYGQRFAPTQDRLRRLSLDATSGFYISSRITHYLDVGYDQFSFTRFSLDVQEYFSIDEGTHHGLAFRQYLSLTHTAGNQVVPFYRLQSIGGSESLRGYTTGRFRDYNMMLFNAEVRCQVWHWLDMAVFGDGGHVFRRFDDIGMGTMRGNVGIGFRLRTDEGTAARLEFARGTEGTRMTLQLGSLL